MEFIEAPAFTRHLAEYLDDEGLRGLQAWLIENPEAGDLIEKTGGFRKLRWQDVRRSKGKRGGLRVIYYLFDGDDQLWLMTIYGKNEKDDLSEAEKAILRTLLESELAVRRKQRGRRARR